MDAGTHDWVNSMVYKVTVEDNAEEYSAEDRMMWVQFIRTLFSDSAGLIRGHFDGEQLARETLKVFNRSPALLASRSANRTPQGLMEGQMQPGIQGNQQNGPGSPGGNVVDMVQGQHSERQAGSRGIDMGNLLRGQMNLGGGTGEY